MKQRKRRRLYVVNHYGQRIRLAPWYVRLYYWLTGKSPKW